jgi:hypothetical protein
MTRLKKDFVYPALLVKGVNLMQKFIASELDQFLRKQKKPFRGPYCFGR